MRNKKTIIGVAAIAAASLAAALAMAGPSSADASNPTIVYSQHVTDPAYTYADPCTTGYYLTSVYAVSDDGTSSTSQTDAYSPTPPVVSLTGVAKPLTVYSSCAWYNAVTVLPAATPSPSASPSPSTSPSASPSPSATSTSPGGYVLPGTVGYLGAVAALTPYSPAGSGLPGAGNAPAGCAWQAYGLRCDNNSYSWDHVLINGGVYWTGVGTFTVTQSEVFGGTGTEWYDLVGHPSNTGTITPTPGWVVKDSTLAWQNGKTYPCCNDVAPIWTVYGNEYVDAERDDLSGFPQGLPGGVGSSAINNWIHGLFQARPGSNPVHLDGAFNQAGNGWLVQGNYIDAPVRTDVTAALFDQDSPMDTGVVVKNNYLNGGAYNLVNDSASGMDVENNTFGSNVYGFAAAPGGTVQGTYSVWSGNVDTSGHTVPEP